MIDEIVSTILKEFKKFPLSINLSEASSERIGEFRVGLIMAFCDSHLFNIGEDGHVYHKTDGSTWAEKVIDGVDLDLTIMWGSGRNDGENWKEEETGEVVVGSRNSSEEVHEAVKKWGKERGEGKFRREKKIPKKKIKKYPTKPKPKNSWHKRLSKVARELGDINYHTEENAVQEIGEFYDEQAIIEEQKEKDYWDSWILEVEANPGNYSVISVKFLVNSDGVSVHDIDRAGVNRSHMGNPYNSEDIREIIMDEWDNLARPATATTSSGGVIRAGGWVENNFFTYWDEEKQMYILKSMYAHSWFCGGWRDYFDYYPNLDQMKEIFSLDKQYLPWKEVTTLSRWINGIEWETVWGRMDQIRTGVMHGRENEYYGGDGFENRSRELPRYCILYGCRDASLQIPRMEFN